MIKNTSFTVFRQLSVNLLISILAISCMLISSGCVSVNSENRTDRALAVSKITDKNELADLAFNAKYEDVRVEAVTKISDQELLRKLALEHKDYKVRLAAAQRLNEPSALAEVALKARDSALQLTAINLITDQNVLTEVVINSSSKEVRWKAYDNKITQEEYLNKIALNSHDFAILDSVVPKVTDQKVLTEIAINHWPRFHSISALKRITDQALIIKIASDSKFDKVRKDAINMIQDPVAKQKAKQSNIRRVNNEVVEKYAICVTHIRRMPEFYQYQEVKISRMSESTEMNQAKKLLLQSMIGNERKLFPLDIKLENEAYSLLLKSIMKRDRIDIEKSKKVAEKLLRNKEKPYSKFMEKEATAADYNQYCNEIIQKPETAVNAIINPLPN